MAKSFLERFEMKVDFNGQVHPTLGTRCHLWTGSTSRGYGTIWNGSRIISAHRAAWILFVGEIQDGASILHRCDVRSCVNWREHLFMGDHIINMADMASKGRAWNPVAKAKSEQTECIHGHPFDVANTWVSQDGRRRSCRSCHRECEQRRRDAAL